MITKPMLAARCTDVNKIKFPVLATPKIDGIRCLRINGRSVSRTFKDIPNRYIQEQMKDLPDGLDGELIVGKTFQETSSGVMSRDGKPEFEYHTFDWINDIKGNVTIKGINVRYASRLIYLGGLYMGGHMPKFCRYVHEQEMENLKQLNLYESEQLTLGYEGIMIRQPDSPYKCGRSTEKEGYLIKIKRFKDSEAIVVGFEEQMENTNVLETNELGYAKRSSSISGKVGKGTLGKFVVREVGETKWKGKIFCIGTGVGLTDKLRSRIWNMQEFYLGNTVTYKYQEIGTKDLPRCPIFKGFRED